MTTNILEFKYIKKMRICTDFKSKQFSPIHWNPVIQRGSVLGPLTDKFHMKTNYAFRGYGCLLVNLGSKYSPEALDCGCWGHAFKPPAERKGSEARQGGVGRVFARQGGCQEGVNKCWEEWVNPMQTLGCMCC